MINETKRLLLPALVLLSGCATVPEPAQPATAERLALSVGPCFGFCPVYEVTLFDDGTLRFVGVRHTAMLGTRERRAGRSRFLAMERDLAAYRPTPGSEVAVECAAAVSDTSAFTVTWTDSAGRKASATVQSGCPGGAGKALADLLRDAPKRLGIAQWTKQTTRPGSSRG